MLISFAPNGSVEFTRSPDLLALFPDDRKSIKRMTTIEFDEELQAHYVKFLLGPHAGKVLSPTDEFAWGEFITEWFSCPVTRMAFGRYVFFPTYEDAVRIEVAYVEFLRFTLRAETMHL